MGTKPDALPEAAEQPEGIDAPSARRRRDAPDRDGPIRCWAALHQQAKAQDQTEAPLSVASPGEEGETDAVAYGVRLGYQVIEEHLRLGQAAARQANTRTYGPDPLSPDLQELLRRVLRSATDVGAVWFDLLDAGLRAPDILRARLRAWTAEGQAAAEQQVLSGPLWVDLVESAERGIAYLRQQLSPQTPTTSLKSPLDLGDSAPFFGSWRGSGGSGGSGGSAGWPEAGDDFSGDPAARSPAAYSGPRSTRSPLGPIGPEPMAFRSGHEAVQAETSVCLEIIASCPTQVTLQLYPQTTETTERTFMTPGLQASDPDKPALTDVTFMPSGENGQTTVRIRVPEGHPPDVYTGAVLDQVSGRPQGTLSVRVDS